jgi:hypothetical protein
MSHGLGIDVELPLPVDEAVRIVRDALKEEGFGVLTEIDLQAAFREKLGREFRPYLILGACNPPLTFVAINADPAIGLLPVQRHGRIRRRTPDDRAAHESRGFAQQRGPRELARAGKRGSRRRQPHGTCRRDTQAGSSTVICPLLVRR